MATHSSTLAWKIPWTEEHGGCQGRGRGRGNAEFMFNGDRVSVWDDERVLRIDDGGTAT